MTKRYPPSELAHVEAERGGISLAPWCEAKPNIRVKRVCANCNNGWMSGLEDAASKIISPLFDLRQQKISARSVPLLAAWAVKTAMALESLALGKSWFYSEPERRQIRLTKTLPQQTYVWLAACAEQETIYAEAHHLAGIQKSPGLQGFTVTLAFGLLAVQVLSFRLPVSAPAGTAVTVQMRDGPWDEVLISVWPAQQTDLTWPPQQALLGESGLKFFAERFGPVAK
jgi:hypothetical protein